MHERCPLGELVRDLVSDLVRDLLRDLQAHSGQAIGFTPAMTAHPPGTPAPIVGAIWGEHLEDRISFED